MNADRVVSLIKSRFPRNLKFLSPRLLRAEKVYRDMLIGVLYFDLSQDAGHGDFELSDYLQRYLARDFYSNEGSLQWNYYLYFVMEKDSLRSLRENGKASAIESDKTFARKFVTDEVLLEEELLGTPTAELLAARPPADLVTAWTEKLTEEGLGGICQDGIPYNRIVEDYISGTPHEPEGSPPPLGARPAILVGKHIEQIRIRRFRKHPSQHEFSFGMANLIRGPNGSGKTSLLEAIELSICGGIRRQGGARPADAAIEIKYMGESEFHTVPFRDPGVYREMDLAWYGSSYRRANRLYDSFGRFNFFDSDAGFRLAQGSGQEIGSAIRDLFLGERASKLSATVQACLEKFQPRERELGVAVHSKRTEITKLENDIATLADIKDTRDVVYKELSNRAKEAGWNELPQELNAATISALQVAIGSLSSSLKRAVSRVPWLPLVSVRALLDEESRLASAFSAIAESRNKRNTEEKKSESLRAALALSTERSAVLTRLAAYHAEPEGLSLLGSRKTLDALESRLEILNEAKAQWADVDVKVLKDRQETISGYMLKLGKSRSLRKKRLLQAQLALKRAQQHTSELQKIVGSLDRLGRRYCKLTPNATECPLCGAQHSVNLSFKLPSKRKPGEAHSLQLKIGTVLEAEEAKVADLDSQKANLNAIYQAASTLVSPSRAKVLTLRDAIRMVSRIGREAESAASKIRDQHITLKRFQARGFGETELAGLFRTAQEVHGLVKATLRTPKGVDALLERERAQQNDLRKRSSRSKLLLASIDTELNRLLEAVLPGNRVKDLSRELSRRREAVGNALGLARSGQKDASIPEEEELLAAASRFESLGQLATRAKQEFRRIEESTALENRWRSALTGSRGDLAKLEEMHSRAGKATQLLRQLMQNEGAEHFLREILSQQNSRLLNIFRRIHSPAEFVNVRIDGDVSLDREGGERSNLAEISTGQRSALAVSIFLSMNSTVGTRAPWIIFDDPVAQVDDLNTLSFLDALRELVTGEQRQLFFATANVRIANLFARKFSFLGDSFKDLPLSRKVG